MRLPIAITAAISACFCIQAFAEDVTYTLNADLYGQPVTVSVAFDNADPGITQTDFGWATEFSIPNATVDLSGGASYSTQGIKLLYSSYPGSGNLNFETDDYSFSVTAYLMQDIFSFHPLAGSSSTASLDSGYVNYIDNVSGATLYGTFTPHEDKTLAVAFGTDTGGGDDGGQPTNDRIVIAGDLSGQAVTFTVDYDPDHPSIVAEDFGYAQQYTMPSAELTVTGTGYDYSIDGVILYYSSSGNMSIESIPGPSPDIVNITVNSYVPDFSLFEPIHGAGGSADIGASSINVTLPVFNVHLYGSFTPHLPKSLTKTTAGSGGDTCSPSEEFNYTITTDVDGQPMTLSVSYDSLSDIQQGMFYGWEELTIPTARFSVTNGVLDYTTTGAVIRYGAWPDSASFQFEPINDPSGIVNQVVLSVDYMGPDFANSDPRVAQSVSQDFPGGHAYLYLNDIRWYANSYLSGGQFTKTVPGEGGCQ